jgi:hypothetical protein
VNKEDARPAPFPYYYVRTLTTTTSSMGSLSARVAFHALKPSEFSRTPVIGYSCECIYLGALGSKRAWLLDETPQKREPLCLGPGLLATLLTSSCCRLIHHPHIYAYACISRGPGEF